MKPKKWSGVKEGIIMFLAISKIMYWMNIIAEAAQSDFENAWGHIVDRILTRDLPIILVIASIIIIERSKGNRYFKLAVGYVSFITITFIYMIALQWIFQSDAQQGLQIFRESFLILTIQYIVIACILSMKEHFSQKLKENPPENEENQE